MTGTRAEHLEWCKKRALELVDAGEIQQAFSSMASDLNKHEATNNHPGSLLGCQMLLSGHLETAGAMRKFINGFN